MFEAPSLNLIETDPMTAIKLPYSSASLKPSTVPSTGADMSFYGSMGLSALSSVIGVIQGVSSIRAQSAYEQSISRTNAVIAGIQAKQARQAGDAEASRRNLQTAQIVSARRAAQGASGTDVASGSNALARLGDQEIGAMDELTIRNNAARAAWGYETEAIQDDYKGQFTRLSESTKVQQTILAGGLQAISGPLAIESNYLRWSRSTRGGTSDLPFPDMKT